MPPAPRSITSGVGVRVEDRHTLGKAIAACQAVLLPASPDSLNGNQRKTREEPRREPVGKESISV